jgi:glycosyltransferase involved in cell wall biosynthesis
MSTLPVSIVMCSRNRPALLRDTIRSVLATPPLPAELVVVDQGDEPDPVVAAMGTVDGSSVVHVPSTTRGLSRARNIGLRAASHPVVVLLDDDMLVEPGWLEPLVTAVAGAPGTVATGRVLAAPPEAGAAALPPAALVAHEEPTVARGPQPRDVMPGANVAVHRDEVLALGGYDERLGAGTRFGAADDNDMGHRLLLAGATIRHEPRSVVLHRAWRPEAELRRLRWAYGRGKGAFYAKHLQLRDRWIARRLARDLARRAKRALTALPRAPRTTAAELFTIAAILAGVGEWLVRERAGEGPRARAAA